MLDFVPITHIGSMLRKGSFNRSFCDFYPIRGEILLFSVCHDVHYNSRLSSMSNYGLLHIPDVSFAVFCLHRSVAVLTECMRNKALAKFFRERQESLRHSLPLGSYLLKPVQRILKYHLLLHVRLSVVYLTHTRTLAQEQLVFTRRNASTGTHL